MGANQSRSISTNDIVNNSMTQVLQESSSNCSQNSQLSQTMTFNNIKTKGCRVDFSNISQDAQISANLTCTQDAQQSTEIANKFATTLDNNIKASMSGVNIGLNNTETETVNGVINNIHNNIEMKSVANCVSQAFVDQKQGYGNLEIDCTGADDKTLSFNNLSQKVLYSAVAKCMQSQKQITQAVNELDTIIKNKQTSSMEGISPFASGIFSLVFLILISLSSVAYVMFSGGSTDVSAITSIIKAKSDN